MTSTPNAIDMIRAAASTSDSSASFAFHLQVSGTAGPLPVYLRGLLAKAGIAATARVPDFNTLQQILRATPPDAEEIFVLMPWDFVGALDWRGGLPQSAPELAACLAETEQVETLLAARPKAAFVYLPAPLPPIFMSPEATQQLERLLTAAAIRLGAILLPRESFSLAAYLASGFPFGGRFLSQVSALIFERLKKLHQTQEMKPAKVLVTDLDNTLWKGIVGEDGPDKLEYGSVGGGFRHFIYQTLLKKLQAEGILLAAVTRNRPKDALAPFKGGQMVLKEEDFVAIVASYQAKSAQIAALAENLNLGLDSFVFVDDNPVELAEIEAALPNVRRVHFPSTEDEMPEVMNTLAEHFRHGDITDEDKRRTELYRTRLAGMVPSEIAGADLHGFLSGLKMKAVMRDRGTGNRTRAVQLINKTTQFNTNGRGFSDEEVAAILAAGGRLISAELSDRTGNHGEVFVCLVNHTGIIQAMVMSCRVFQRRLEFGALVEMTKAGIAFKGLDFKSTDRNEPLRNFIKDEAFGAMKDGIVSLDISSFAAAHKDDHALFEVEWQ